MRVMRVDNKVYFFHDRSEDNRGGCVCVYQAHMCVEGKEDRKESLPVLFQIDTAVCMLDLGGGDSVVRRESDDEQERRGRRRRRSEKKEEKRVGRK